MTQVARHSILTHLTPFFAELGYKFNKSEEKFSRKTKDGQVFVYLKIRPSIVNRDKIVLEFSVGVRFDLIEKIYACHDRYLDKKLLKSQPTVIASCYSRFFSQKMIEVYQNDLMNAVELIERSFINEVNIFIERYSSYLTLVECAKNSSYDSWMFSSYTSRFIVLLSDASINNDKASFDRYFSELIDYSRISNDGRVAVVITIANGIKSENPALH